MTELTNWPYIVKGVRCGFQLQIHGNPWITWISQTIHWSWKIWDRIDMYISKIHKMLLFSAICGWVFQHPSTYCMRKLNCKSRANLQCLYSTLWDWKSWLTTPMQSMAGICMVGLMIMQSYEHRAYMTAHNVPVNGCVLLCATIWCLCMTPYYRGSLFLMQSDGTLDTFSVWIKQKKTLYFSETNFDEISINTVMHSSMPC